MYNPDEVASNEHPPLYDNGNDVWDMRQSDWESVLTSGQAPSDSVYRHQGRAVRVIVASTPTYMITLESGVISEHAFFGENGVFGGNAGTITFDSVTYSLPKELHMSGGLYTTTVNPPGSFSFHHWECSGGVSLSLADKYAKTAVITVSGEGSLLAVLFYRITLVFSTGESYYPVKGLSYDGDDDITNNYVNYREDAHAHLDLDEDNEEEAPAYLVQSKDGSYTVLEYWVYYAYDNKKIAGLPCSQHEHDFESIYLWIDSDYYIVKLTLSQHEWVNQYGQSFGAEATILVGVEEGGHGMVRLNDKLEKVKPDNSDLTQLDGAFTAASRKAEICPWAAWYSLFVANIDGFGSPGSCTTAYIEPGPLPFVATAHLDSSVIVPIFSIDLVNIGTNVYESITEPILLKSSSPISDLAYAAVAFQGLTMRYLFHITAPWVRAEFWDPSLQWKRLGCSQWYAKKTAIAIANWASLGLGYSITSLPGLAVTFAKLGAFTLPDFLGIINDPTDLTITDTSGNVLGYKDGKLVDEIPGGFLLVKGPAYELYLIMNNSTDYVYTLKSRESGSYSFYVAATYVNQTANTVWFNATDIPMQGTSVHEYRFDWPVLLRNEKGAQIGIDQDGDGVYEKALKTNSTLTPDMLTAEDPWWIKYQLPIMGGVAAVVLLSLMVAFVRKRRRARS
jgi:hypothetical protein